MNTKEYSWKFGNGNGVSASVFGNELEEIERENKVVTKESVVERARSEDSPLHSMFEWDNDVAGEMYRLEQARHYIKAIEVKIVPVGTTDGSTIKVRGFYNVAPINPTANQPVGQYINVNTAINNPETYEIILNRAKRELGAFRNKYKTLKELKPVMDAIDSVV